MLFSDKGEAYKSTEKHKIEGKSQPWKRDSGWFYYMVITFQLCSKSKYKQMQKQQSASKYSE